MPKIMPKNILILIAATLVLILGGFNVLNAEESAQQESTQQAENAKSVAWYVANIREARAKNQECYDNPSMQASLDCANALHALQISFNGGN